MNRLLAVWFVSLCWCCVPAAAAEPLPTVPAGAVGPLAPWAAERVKLLDGRRYEGLIESEDAGWVHMIQVRRLEGRPMHLVIRPIERALIKEVDRLDAEQRAKLRRRIDAFIHRAEIEAARMGAIHLDSVTQEGKQFFRYHGKWFTLDCHAESRLARQIAVRIEQIFTAYRQIIASRTEPETPLRIVVLGSVKDYHAYLEEIGVRVRNPACFLPDENLVIAGSDLARLAAELSDILARHTRLRAELDAMEELAAERLAKVARELREQGLSRATVARRMNLEKANLDRHIRPKRLELKGCDRENAQKFGELTQRMFSRLYHEAFHAYLENYVYPHRTHDVPRWLNEGLAVMFERGRLESGTLRVDAPNRTAMKYLQADLRAERPWSLRQVLAAAPHDFLLEEAGNRAYAYSWGLVYYLACEKHLLNPPALDAYVRPAAPGTSPVQRFEKLVGTPIEEFERDWRRYVLNLR